MDYRKPGKSGPKTSAIGLGWMGMSDFYGPADRDESIATIHAALDAGITLLDTGDFYGVGHNELLIRDALAGRSRDNVRISVKFGALRDPARGFTAYGVLARGLISGHWSQNRTDSSDFRNMTPRFQGRNLDTNLALVEKLRGVGDDLGASVAQVAIAWVLAQGSDIVPLVGARRRDRLTEALGALEVTLTPAHLAALAKAIPVGAAAGAPYPQAQLSPLHTEKRNEARGLSARAIC